MKTTDETLPSPVPVYVTYFTAWLNEDGTVEYFDDVYGRDVLTLAAMKATTEQRTANAFVLTTSGGTNLAKVAR